MLMLKQRFLFWMSLNDLRSAFILNEYSVNMINTLYVRLNRPHARYIPLHAQSAQALSNSLDTQVV